MTTRDLLETLTLSIPSSTWYTTKNLFPGHYARRCGTNAVRILSDKQVLVGLDARRDNTAQIDAPMQTYYEAMATDSSQNEDLEDDLASNRTGQVLVAAAAPNTPFVFVYRPGSKVIVKNLDAATSATVYLQFIWEGSPHQTRGI